MSRLRDGRLTNYGPRDGVPERVIAVLEDAEGIMWAGGLVGLSRFRNNRWERAGISHGLPEEEVVSRIYQDHQ